MKVETGNLTSPDGTPYNGFKVTIGGVMDPGIVERRYEDIEKILGRNQVPYKIHEETTLAGKFRSYTVLT